MAQGPLDHPSYLTRQRLDLGIFSAGANNLGNPLPLQYGIRAHNLSIAVKTAGTATANTAQFIYVGTYTLTASGTNTTTSGTNTVGTLVISTATANTFIQGTDMNVTLNPGGVCYVKNGADTAAVYLAALDYSIDPVLGTWTGV